MNVKKMYRIASNWEEFAAGFPLFPPFPETRKAGRFPAFAMALAIGKIVRPLLLSQWQTFLITPATKNRKSSPRRDWAKALIYFVLSTYPGLKSGAIV